MGFDALIRNALSTATRVTASLQDAVVHEALTGAADAYGQPVYSTGVNREAIVERVSGLGTQALVRTATGEDVVPVAHVTFTAPVAIAVGDRLTLADGTVTTVRVVGGVTDPSTGMPYAPDVWVN